MFKEENVNSMEERDNMLQGLEMDPLEKRIRMTVEKARMEAKINDTYVVYMDKDGDIVKEYPDGRIVKNS